MFRAVVPIALIFVFTMLVSPPALKAAVGKSEPSLFSMTLQMLTALVLVLGLFLLLYALVRKSRGWLPGKTAGQHIEVRAVRHLGPKKALYLVDVDGRRFFLSAAGEQVRLLSGWSVDGSGIKSATEASSGLEPNMQINTSSDFDTLMQQHMSDADAVVDDGSFVQGKGV